jgi:hypothetical protein
VNLKVLRIGGSFRDFPDEQNSFKKKLIENLPHLQRLALRLTINPVGDEHLVMYYPAGDDDVLMAHLVEKNPHLIEINGMDLTENGIRLLSSMKHLQIATDLRLESRDQIIPMLMLILTGNSQNSILKVSVRVRPAVADDPLDFDYYFRPMRNETLQKEVVDHLLESGMAFRVTSNKFGDALILTRESGSAPKSPFTDYNGRRFMAVDDFFYSQFE